MTRAKRAQGAQTHPKRRRRAWILAASAVVLTLVTAVQLGSAAVVQVGNLRITLLSQVIPYKLPRQGTAPIAVLVSGHVDAVKGGVPDQLRDLTVKVNRHAILQSRGLPVCPFARIQPASTASALRKCGPAVIGSGQFWAQIVLPEQGTYPTQGRVLIFNGRLKGHPALLAHIYTSHPFTSSFVIPFTMRQLGGRGVYGTELVASLPRALGEWGYVDRIKLTLRRQYRFRGQRLSYFSAGCPALPSANRASYRLAFATFGFSHGRRIGVEVTKSCGVVK